MIDNYSVKKQTFNFGNLISWFFSLCVLAIGILLSVHVMTSSARAAEGEMPRCMPDQELLTEIKKRRQELEQRQQMLQKKDEDIAVREKVLKEEMKKLEDLRSAMTAQQLVSNAKIEERVAKLVETMQTMSPKASAKLMAEIEEDLAVEAMSRMSTPKLAKILNLIEPTKASILSEKLAGREGKRPEKKESVPAVPKETERQPASKTTSNSEQSLLDGKDAVKSVDKKKKADEKATEKGGSANADTTRTS